MARNVGYLTAKQTKASDECYTPKYAVLPILEFINKKWVIWCPFDTKDSEFVKVLKENGNKVIYSHLNDGKDFFSYEPKQKYDVIISNPPYSLKDEVIKRCYLLKKKFMLLMPLPALQGKFRLTTDKCFIMYGTVTDSSGNEYTFFALKTSSSTGRY